MIPTNPQSTLSGRYLLHEKLGQGGMGTIYRASDRFLGGEVALKRLLLPEVSDPQPQSTLAMTEILRMSLAQEFQTLASLRHPHIISVLDYGFDADRQPFFTMEYLHNASTIVAAGLNLSLEDRIDLVIQMLLALTYLHLRGILHRDLKPGSVLVVGGRVHLLDFGLSVPREQASGTVGTIMYMAPEVVREEPQDERTDLYAVGVILYELIAGKHPFEASTSNKLLVDILVTPPDIDSLDTTEDLKVVLLLTK